MYVHTVRQPFTLGYAFTFSAQFNNMFGVVCRISLKVASYRHALKTYGKENVHEGRQQYVVRYLHNIFLFRHVELHSAHAGIMER